METIIVKDITLKAAKGGNLMILKINGNREATLAPFEKQEQNFLEHDVGVGGNFKGEVVTNGKFTNIKNIDFNSAMQASQEEVIEVANSEPKANVPVEAKGSRDSSIIAQALTKCACYGSANLTVEDVWKRYEFFLDRLK